MLEHTGITVEGSVKARRIASIDFGTNTARLLIADIYPDKGFKQILIEREIVRMGGGFDRRTGLSADAVCRGMACLARFSSLIRGYSVDKIMAVATSAVRDASNGPEFTSSVLNETGIELRVIDGTLEAELTLAGVLAGLSGDKHDNIMVFDVGGGSTEYTVAIKGKAVFSMSLPLGVVRLTEGKVTPYSMLDKINRELHALGGSMSMNGIRIEPDKHTLVGTAGTATTLAAISMEMEDYDYRRVNNYVLSIREIKNIYDRLLPLSPEERLMIPGLERGREDLIIAGILLTIRTMDLFGFRSMKVSDYGLLEGLAVMGERLSQSGEF